MYRKKKNGDLYFGFNNFFYFFYLLLKKSNKRELTNRWSLTGLKTKKRNFFPCKAQKKKLRLYIKILSTKFKMSEFFVNYANQN